MSKKLTVVPHTVRRAGSADGSYITQMLRELAIQARDRDAELAYFIEMALTHSSDLDDKEKLAERLSQTASA